MQFFNHFLTQNYSPHCRCHSQTQIHFETRNLRPQGELSKWIPPHCWPWSEFRSKGLRLTRAQFHSKALNSKWPLQIKIGQNTTKIDPQKIKIKKDIFCFWKKNLKFWSSYQHKIPNKIGFWSCFIDFQAILTHIHWYGKSL